ncbi:MAG: hypothetical protein MJ163_00085 [Alphaproteobacteria bacterium]|nr:hypothetical protein [Alphaproteobacteria bacterium]
MASKNSSRNKIVWFLIFTLSILVLSVVTVPPLINLNFLKPKIENVILSQTGIPAKIHGDINFTLLGKTTIVAHNITIPNGTVESCKFSVPFFDIFNLKNARISSNISVSGASLVIEKLTPFEIKNTISVKDSNIQFLNKEYTIIDAKLSKHDIDAIIRTDQHKYEIKSRDNKFVIKNKNNYLNMSGRLFNNGTADAHIEIIAEDINRWFEFEKPQINGQFPITADLFWDGSYGVRFTNISANGITGSIDIKNNGYKIVKLKSNNADYDLSFFVQDPDVFQDISFDLDFYGDLKFSDYTFKHVKIITVGSKNELKVDTIIADDLQIHGGTIDKDGGHNLHVSVPEFGTLSTCLFNGTPTNWTCDNFSYGGIVSGTLKINPNQFEVDLYSPEPFKNFNTVIGMARLLGANGYVKFDTPDMKGILTLTDNQPSVSYTRLNSKSLNWAKIDLPFIPDFMREEKGDFVWTKDSMMFIPDSKQWQLSTSKDFFIIHGQNFKTWLGNLDLQSLRDLHYTLSGNYKNENISNLTLEIGQQKFTGSATAKSLTLKTSVLDIDYLLDPYFVENFEEASFFSQSPVMILFDLNTNVAVSADSIIYNNKKYNNFIYSLHDDTQTFSISGSKHGNMLTKIKRHNTKYALNIQLNKFIFDKKLLPLNMPLNISDTAITADIKLNTSGKIAHDIINNLNGTFDVSFDGGKLYGFGFDDFYASAKQLTLLNSEYFLSKALSGGITNIKKMHLVGTYESGDIKTLRPFVISMKHVDASGMFEIKNNEMNADLDIVLRGTSAEPELINVVIFPNNTRKFSLSEIMTHFDFEYMKAFIESHSKF